MDKGEVYLFKSKEDANDFAKSNISDFDHYKIMDGKELSKDLPELSLNKTNSFTQKQML